jgi:hypothetical protein
MKCKHYRGVKAGSDECERIRAKGKILCEGCKLPEEAAKQEEKMAKEKKCKGCGEVKKIQGRGLCSKCYYHATKKKKGGKRGRKPGGTRKPGKTRRPGPVDSLFHVDVSAIKLNPDAPTEALKDFRDQINAILDERLEG